MSRDRQPIGRLPERRLLSLVFVFALAVGAAAPPAFGQVPSRETEEGIVRDARESFRSALTAQERAYVEAICKSRLARHSFPVRDKLRAEAERLIEAKAIDDAKLYFHLIDRVADVDRRLGAIACTPSRQPTSARP